MGSREDANEDGQASIATWELQAVQCDVCSKLSLFAHALFYCLISLNSLRICVYFSQDVPTRQVVLHSSAEASTSKFQASKGDEVDIKGTTSIKKKSRSPVWQSAFL